VVRTTLGAEVETSVTVSGSESVDYINRDQTTDLPAGDREVVIVRPPAGFVYELLGLRFLVRDIPAATTGSQEVQVQSEAERIGILAVKGSQSDNLNYTAEGLSGGTVFADPADTTSQILAPRGLRADENRGFRFRTFNRTDADNSVPRQYRLWVRQIQVGDT